MSLDIARNTIRDRLYELPDDFSTSDVYSLFQGGVSVRYGSTVHHALRCLEKEGAIRHVGKGRNNVSLWTKGVDTFHPEKGQEVWMIVNGEPALRYFVEFYADGCRVAFNADLNEIYYTSPSLFYRSKVEVLRSMIESIHSRRRDLEAELKVRMEQLGGAL